MNRKIRILLLILTCVLAFAGCQCEHDWRQATCTTPKTCRLCDETEGEALGHAWADATCTEAKKCKVCGTTEGEALGHSWQEATCAAPKTCSGCKLTEGEALPHTWVEATTEAPKTCTGCGATEGERIITDSRFTSAAAAPVVGTWTAKFNSETLGVEELPAGLEIDMTITFEKDGKMKAALRFDKRNYIDVMLPMTVEMLYNQFSSMGLDKDSANAAMLSQYGMSVEEYAAYSMEQMSESDFNSEYDVVYYVQEGQIFSSESWEDTFEPVSFMVEGDKLTLTDDGETGAQITMTRAREE